MGEPSDVDLWRCVESTLRTTILPALTDEWARRAAVQLVGLAEHATSRPPDATAERAAELGRALDLLADNPLVFDEWPIASNDPAAVLAVASRVLVTAVADTGPAGAEVHTALRLLLVRHADEDLAITGCLLPLLRGVLDGADAAHA